MTLHDDIARCEGAGNDEGWREGCETCLRRTSARNEWSSWMEPPVFITFECEYLIEDAEREVKKIGDENEHRKIEITTFDSFFTEMQRIEDERDPVGAQDRLDAKRYRWIRDIGNETWMPLALFSTKCVDDAIDAAMAKK